MKLELPAATALPLGYWVILQKKIISDAIRQKSRTDNRKFNHSYYMVYPSPKPLSKILD